MEVTYIGMIFMALAAFGFLAGARVLVVLLGVALPLPAAAAINLPAFSNVSVLCSTMMILVFTARYVVEIGSAIGHGSRMRLSPAGLLLTLFAIYGLISGLLFPRVLDGTTEVFSLERGIVGIAARNATLPLVPLHASSGNITQPAYMLSSCLLFLCLVRMLRLTPAMGPRLIAAVAISHAVVGAIDAVSPVLPVQPLLEFIRTANYAIAEEQAVNGMRRVIGGAPEASVFGPISAALTAYFLFLAASTRSPRHWLAVAVFTLLTFLSLSSTGLVVWLVVVAMFAVSQLLPARGYFSRRQISRVFIFVGFGMVGLLVLVHTPALDVINSVADRLLFNKLSTSSGVERSAWARQSLINFADTFGLGVGLGSSRGSGWIFTVLGQTGFIGTVLMLGFLFTSIFRPAPVGSASRTVPAVYFRPARAAACAMLAAEILSSARVDLGYLFFCFAAMATASLYGARDATAVAAAASADDAPRLRPVHGLGGGH